ncbi:HAD family hydrolase [Sphaerotilus mobilis]|uniref:Putative hydrolase of the HAD superfamily n=1 Tax=Sphaerotilus mobilis TaxID=47994 RepID=A0A4Q7LG95_9BURK|nr:HAD family phosphatase [Sphaerotilus mobilis]RZS53043.1 putative hydrolase of the HAD superfamily [Sphaerotilus mobilis]
MKKHLIFDFGAVVFRWQPVDLLREVLPAHASDADAARALAERIFKGYTDAWGRFDHGTIEVPELVEALAVQSGLSAAEMQRLVDAVPAALEPLPDTVAWLDRLRAAGHRLFYLSNMPAPFADQLEARHAFLGHFESGVFSGRVQLAKPDAAIFRLALERFGIAAEDTVFFDDHPANVDAARALGLHAVLFQNAAQAEADLRAEGLVG